MWPFDAADDVLRVGAQALELWRGDSSSRELVARRTLAHRCSMYDPDGLRESLEAVAALVRDGKALVVLESAFVPLVLADTGGTLWKPEQVEALLRHRFRLTYGGPEASVDSWQVRTDFRFGERFALGYAMAPAVEAVLAEQKLSGKLAWRGWLPSFAWGMAQLKPWRRWPWRTGWFGWPEQDRMLLAYLERGRVTALNPAAPLQTSAAAVESVIDLQAKRSGVDAGGRACVATWDAGDPPAPSARVEWLPIEGSGRFVGSSRAVSSQTASPA